MCFESAEYIDYLEAYGEAVRSKYPGAFQNKCPESTCKALLDRFWAEYTAENPFVGEKAEVVCSRCEAVAQYEAFIGPDVVKFYVCGTVDEE